MFAVGCGDEWLMLQCLFFPVFLQGQWSIFFPVQQPSSSSPSPVSLLRLPSLERISRANQDPLATPHRTPACLHDQQDIPHSGQRGLLLPQA